MAAPAELLKLVKQFRDNQETYLSAAFSETALRLQFIDPMFELLGWDIYNRQGNAEAFKDVVHEDSLKIGGSTKAPDYSFRIGGTRIFFVEAKKPAVKIKQDVAPAFQLRRYAWSAKLPLSILANFEEFAVYDCRVRPDKTDSSSTARTMYFTFDQYEDRWDEIAGVFSREAVLKGSFDRYAESTKKKRGTAEVDAAFLDDIEQWRVLLARNLALRNPQLSQRDLNFAVQKTIDRIIFLRICEDRGMETYGRLQVLPNGPNIYPRVCELFREADQRYNSGLFHFAKEKDRHETPDEWTLALAIDDAVLKDIIRKLYYPESPYEFSVIGADILGQVYEQFLGKVIRLTVGHQAKVEEKPEVRKAGGVYYTPTYIVEYLVKNTVGKLLEGKTPYEIAARTAKWKPAKDGRPLSLLDPACGSGSFLIGAYQYLLDWYRDWFVADAPVKHKDRVYQSQKGQWRLSTAERKRILLDHIYGVDIDPQAVEVTKLSLLLKVLEGETKETLQRQLFAKQRALPDLANNIKCGNSLIGPDFYHGKQLDLFDDDERLRINVFDWQAEFHEIIQSGGFDAVIGNPPYIFTRQLLTPLERSYFASRYELGWEKQNTFMLFMEKMLSLLRVCGKGGYIVPNSWLTIESAKLLRRPFVQRLELVADLNYAAFVGVSMEPMVFVVSGANATGNVHTLRATSRDDFLRAKMIPVKRRHWLSGDGRIAFSQNVSATALIKRICEASGTIADAFDVRTGLQAYERGKGNPPQSAAAVGNHIFDRDKREDDNSLRYLQGRDIARYYLGWSGMWMQYGRWLSQPRELEIFSRPRILLREITGNPPYALHATFVEDVFLNNKSALNVLHVSDDTERLMLLLGILNSRFITLHYKERAVKSARRIFPKVVIKNLREFPFPLDVPDRIASNCVRLVGTRIALEERSKAAATPHESTALDRQIEATDREIDQLVYELYGLTDEEIRIVEESTAAVPK